MTYSVKVERDGDRWVGTVLEVPGAHTEAGNLVKLDEYIREAIAAMLDLPEGAEAEMDIRFVYVGLSEAAMAAANLGHRRAFLDRQQAELAEATRAAVHQLGADGWSMRDIGPLLGITAGRVSQIAMGPAPENSSPLFQSWITPPDGYVLRGELDALDALPGVRHADQGVQTEAKRMKGQVREGVVARDTQRRVRKRA